MVRRETGKEQVVQVHYDESLASYVAPEPCALAREGKGEASVGERAGQPLSRERSLTPGADAVTNAEGIMDRDDSASPRLAGRGQRPWHVRTLLVREPGDLGIDLRMNTAGPHREGGEP